MRQHRTLVQVLSIVALLSARHSSAQSVRPQFEDPKQVAELLKAEYPLDLRLLGLGGTVRVSLHVMIGGTVASVSVINSSGIPSLDEAAGLAARRFRFRKNVRALAVELPLTFQPDTVSTLSMEQLPKLLNRPEVQTLAADALPANVRNGGIDLSVPVLVVVDSAGNASRFGIVASSCFREFDDAALAGARAMKFSAADSSGGALRRTIGTFEFTTGSVRVRVPEEAAPSRGTATDSAEGGVSRGPTMAPQLVNMKEVQAALAAARIEMGDRNPVGTVGMWMLVDEQGSVVRRRIKTSSGECLLDAAALDVARIVRFSPAMRNGKPIKAWVDAPFVFPSR